MTIHRNARKPRRLIMNGATIEHMMWDDPPAWVWLPHPNHSTRPLLCVAIAWSPR